MTGNTTQLKTWASKKAERELARRHYADYFLYSHDFDSKMFPHTQLICDKLEDIVDGYKRDYIVEMPPQHGKSTTITETFPSYYLMRHPDKKVMVASYSIGLAQRFGTSNLQKFKKYGNELFDVQLSNTKQTSNEWRIKDHDGVMFATTILGAATGNSADLLIIDDPIKGDQDANSPTILNKIWHEWQSSFYTRLSANASIIVIMTRWNVDDLAGRLLKEKALPWEEIKLPAIAEDKYDQLNRKEGEPLCPYPPMNKDKKWAEQTQRVVGPHRWASLYQQRPVQDGGNVFKSSQIHYYVPDAKTAAKLGVSNDSNVAILPNIEKEWSSWDLTFSASETSDYVAGQTWGKNGADFYLLDRVHERMDFGSQLRAIVGMHNRHKLAPIYIENKANGSAIIDTIRRKVSGVISIIPHGDKVTRANAVVPFFEADNIYVPYPLWKPEIRKMIDEWIEFPNILHDDEVDSMTQALTRYVKGQDTSLIGSMDTLF
ncbi:phage terminase large subunit [Apilactobacillus micheneri]|uniref:phage terminase large subunit n=1 Tax=Apilactobacillus micheneri TaxID=1899430 RepID=UPI000D0278A7|nr:phage terminase large subunit [Apilactobacillus micheneri]